MAAVLFAPFVTVKKTLKILNNFSYQSTTLQFTYYFIGQNGNTYLHIQANESNNNSGFFQKLFQFISEILGSSH